MGVLVLYTVDIYAFAHDSASQFQIAGRQEYSTEAASGKNSRMAEGREFELV